MVAGLLLMGGLAMLPGAATPAMIHSQGQDDEAPEPLRPTDELLEELVEKALAEDEVVRSYELVVNVLDGSVTLYGTVDSSRERERAGAVAGEVSGVREVENRVEVEDELLPDVPSDETIYERILAVLAEKGVETKVEVLVQDGLATLTGIVPTRKTRRELSELAFRAGAVLVRNELKVTDEGRDSS